MNKRIGKLLCFLMLVVVVVAGVKLDTQAAGGLSITASASQVNAGGTFNVTVKAANNYFVSNVALSVSGGTVVSGLGATSLDKGESAKATIKLTGETCTVSVSGIGANYDTVTEGPASASVSVKKKVVVVDNRSKDNTLSALSVSEGSLSPAFNAATTQYSVSVGGAVDKITLSAQANHAKAKVSGTGEMTVVPGNNQFVIVCTAENGAKKQYTVNVHVDETPLVFTTYNNQKLGVVRNQSNIGVPTSFEGTTITLEGQEVQAYRSNQLNKTLVYLQDEAGNANFYIYDEVKGITSVFKPISLLGRNVIVYDLTEEEKVRENMVYSEVTIDGQNFGGWTYENPDFANYIHILVMNEFGEKVVYQYEKTENSLQLFREYEELEPEVPEEPVEEKKPFWEEYYLQIIAVLGVLVIILFITMICLVATRKNKHQARRRRAQKKLAKKTEE